MKDKVVDIRADIGAALLNEGEFNTPADGLTVFIRELNSDGTIRGVMVHDNRNEKHPITYLAVSGQLAQTPGGARLIMFDGTVEQSGHAGGQLTVLQVPALRLRPRPVRQSHTRDEPRHERALFAGTVLAELRDCRKNCATPTSPRAITGCRSRSIALPSR